MLYFPRLTIFFAAFFLLCGHNAHALDASFTADYTSGCAGLTVHFTNTSTGASSYDWNFGNGDSSTLTNPSTSFSTAGTYTVKLTASSGSSTATYTVTITIYNPPTVSFSASDTAVCLGASINFSDGSTLGSPGSGTYKWNFGDGNSSTSENPSYTYNKTGAENVTLSVTNSAGCTSSLSKKAYVDVYGPPTANFAATNTFLCDTPASTTFVNTSSGTPTPLSYSWDFGDGSASSTTMGPSHTYHSLGNFTVTLIVTNGAGCKDTLVQSNYISVTKIYPSFTAPTSACAGTYVIFTNTSTPATTGTTWYFGDDSTASGGTETHMYTTAGTYNVKMITQNGPCKDSITKAITINPQPVINFSESPVNPCPAPAIISFSNSTTGASRYVWDFGDSSGTSTSTSPNHTYYRNGSYTVKLIAYSSLGCADSVVKTNFVNIYPLKLDIYGNGHDHEIGSCVPYTLNFTYTPYYDTPFTVAPTLYPDSVSTASWNFGDGTTSTSKTPTHTYTTYGTFKVTLTITTVNGCSVSDTFTVLTGPKPTANFTATPTTNCVDQKTYFKNLSDSALDYTWFFGDGSVAVDDTPTYVYSLPGVYTVTLIADNNGCKDTLTRTNYIHILNPKSLFEFVYACSPYQQINFYMDDTVGFTSYLYQFGDGTEDSTVLHPKHAYPGVGTYTARLLTYNDTTGCRDTMGYTIKVTHPIASFSASDTVICANSKVLFTAFLSGASPYSFNAYTWTFDTVSIVSDTANTIDYKFTKPGYHTVSVIINDNRIKPLFGCLDSATRIHYIAVAQPDVKFSASPTTGCAPLNVFFIDSSTDISSAHVVSRLWDFGDSATASGSGPSISHTYKNGGDYYVQLIATDNIGCVDTLTKVGYINVHQPKANFTSYTTTACEGRPVTFTNTSSGLPLKSFWNFGDGTTSNLSSPSHPYYATGAYTVTLVVTDSIGCKDSITKIAYINVVANPVASFTMSDTFKICSPLTVDFTNTSTSGTTSFWDFGDGNTSTDTNPEDIYVDSGIYRITLIVTNSNGCTDTAYGTATILGYAGVLSYTPLTGCAPLTVHFKANISGVPKFIYDFSDGTTLDTTADSAVHTYTTPGPFVPKLVMTNDSGCQSESIGLDTIKVDGIFAGFSYLPYPACDSGTFELLDTSYGSYSTVTYQEWIFDDGTTSTNNIVTHYYPSSGSYPVTLILNTSSGCVDTFHTNFVIHRSPIISAGLDTTICKGDAATLMPSGGVTYVWSPNTDLSCDSCTNPNASPKVPTFYTVVGYDTNGCHGTDTMEVLIKTKTTSIASDSGQICQGNSLQLKDSGGVGTTYNWIPPTGLNDSHSPTPVASPSSTTTYMIIAQQGSCIPDTNYVTVTVHPLPDINLGPNQTIIAGNSAQISATGTNMTTFLWTPSETLSCDSCSDPVATPPKTTKYTVVVTSDFGCIDSAALTIYVVCDQSQVFMPNTFTPNGDGIDDIFYPRGKGLQIIKSFRIYDRWGQLVFSRQDININDITNGWDGTFKGAKLNPDVFVYVVDAICETGEPVTWKGDISLIR